MSFRVQTRGFVLGLIFAAWFVAPTAAQISPGALSRAHKSLDGATQCASCHKLGGGEPVFRCLDCHTEIASRLSAHRGLHWSYGIQAGSSQECARCHSEHNGSDFPLIKWDIKKFEHKQTGYVLEGKHEGLTCNRCHTPDHIGGAERAAIRMKDPARTFLGVSTACITCHQDQHNGRLGPNCQQCHNFTDWKTTSKQFDHSKTRYPLTGLHAQVACQKCHTPAPDGKPRYAGLPFGKCSDCHADVHHGSFAQTCQSCHNTSGWKRVSVGGLNSSFDHAKTKFLLVGKHQGVDCLQCHQNGDFKKAVAFAKCADCHKPDSHHGQFAKRPDQGECGSCHNEQGWKPAKFGLKEHAETAYPLVDKHAQVECAQCHIPKGKETLFKIKFARCLDCHKDEHGGQFAAAPYSNRCEQCHNLKGYKPSLFTLEQHKKTRFLLTDGHLAVPCGECHKPMESANLGSVERKPLTPYHFDSLTCTSCHKDPHQGEFAKRTQQLLASGKPAGCQACHSTKAWKELSRFDHASTQFVLVGAHRGVACGDCHKPPNLETTLLHVNFSAAPVKCEDCHADSHGGQFANGDRVTECASCHNSNKWKPSLFEHDKRTSFALKGAHQNVRCAQCHSATRETEGKPVLFYKPTPKECAACHGADPKFKTIAR